MIANYGYTNGSGKYFISIDTDKCNGCGSCVEACPRMVLEIGEDPNDPLRETPVVYVREEERKKLKYTCAPCKPVGRSQLPPCVIACKEGAIRHSW
jgi:ferredoxin